MGPFGTEGEARVAALAATSPDEDSLLTSAGNRRMLDEACSAARVPLGAYDRRILAWLAGWEPATVAVVCGLISRAHEAGRATAEARAAATVAAFGRVAAVLAAFDWEQDDRQQALEAIERIVLPGDDDEDEPEPEELW